MFKDLWYHYWLNWTFFFHQQKNFSFEYISFSGKIFPNKGLKLLINKFFFPKNFLNQNNKLTKQQIYPKGTNHQPGYDFKNVLRGHLRIISKTKYTFLNDWSRVNYVLERSQALSVLLIFWNSYSPENPGGAWVLLIEYRNFSINLITWKVLRFFRYDLWQYSVIPWL